MITDIENSEEYKRMLNNISDEHKEDFKNMALGLASIFNVIQEEKNNVKNE